jgi:hypothetical protein
MIDRRAFALIATAAVAGCDAIPHELVHGDDSPDATPQPACTIWYQDADGDGFGTVATTRVACSQPTGYVAVKDDCDDANVYVNPGHDEVCDLIDNDCDGDTLEPCADDCVVKVHGGHRYLFCSAAALWIGAKSKCEAADYVLASVEDQSENDYLLAQARSLFGPVPPAVFLGGNDRMAEGSWRWAGDDREFWLGDASGMAVGDAFVKWDDQHPGTDTAAEDCLGMWLTHSFGNLLRTPGKWNDFDCNVYALPFVCERS